MKYWTYLDAQGRYITLSESQILDVFWAHWIHCVLKAGYLGVYSTRDCITDWAIVHWAWQSQSNGEDLPC